MKKIYVIILTVFLNSVFLSCNPENMIDEAAPQACCGENGEIPPPPPPTTPPTTPPSDEIIVGG